MKMFVSATEFCRCNKSQKNIYVRLVAATKFCCSDKDFHKRSPVHTKRFLAAKCRRDMLLQLLRVVCTDPYDFIGTFLDVYLFLGNRVRFFFIGPEYQVGPDFLYST